jgi:small conductance mechanosensitive channel
MKLLKNLEIYKKYLYTQVINYSPKVIQSIIVFIIFYFIGRYVHYKLVNLHYKKDGEIDTHSKNKILVDILANILYYSSIVIGLFTALVILGINVNSILVLFGSIGFAVALSLKDTLANASSGVMILLLDYFDLGNLVSINDVGPDIVHKFNLFTTTLKSEGVSIIYPNTTITNGIIKNYSKLEDIRIKIDFVISNFDKDIPINTILETIKNEIISQSKYLTDKKNIYIGVSSMHENSTTFTAYIPIKSINFKYAMGEILSIIKNSIESNSKLFVTTQSIKIVP